jgi:Ca-activated chloride channel homolog
MTQIDRMQRLMRTLFSLPHNGLGAHSAPARERRGASGPRKRPSRGPGQSPGLVDRCVASCGLILAFASFTALGQELPANAPHVEILSPGQGNYVNGPTLLRARVEPIGAASSITFFVDGRQVCTLTSQPFECNWDAGQSVKEHQVRLVVNRAVGGRIVRTVRTKGLDYVEKVEVDVVQVTAAVLDANGHYVKGLTQSAFRVFEDDRPQTISHFASEDVPLDLVVIVDISGSMAPAMPKLKVAVKNFLSTVPARDRVTLLGFNDSVFALVRGATNPADRLKAVDRLAAWGATALYDAIRYGMEMLGRQVGRKAIVVFTDGEDEGSHALMTDVERRLQASDVTLFMIGQGRGVTMEPLRKIMERLSRPTGGRALFTDSIDELHEAFTDLLDELSQQYLLSYPPTNSARDDTFRRIKVTVDGKYQVRARQGYRASPSR